MKVWKVWEFNCNKKELEDGLNNMQKAGKEIKSISSCTVSDWGRCYKGMVVYTEEDINE